jgi:CheY-like chemotaxis protein
MNVMNKKILAVDDEPAIRSMMKLLQRRPGWEVDTAGSAEEALQMILQQNYDVFFLDLNLPGMDGIELCRHIRKMKPNAVAFAVTGYACGLHRQECISAGFTDYFTKPVKLNELLKAAERFS